MNWTSDGIRKAAILVSSLDRATADRLLEQMTDEQAARVRRAMVDLGDVDPQEQRRIIDEFFHTRPRRTQAPAAASTFSPPRTPRAAGVDVVADEPMRAGAGGEQPFRSLREAEADKLAKVLHEERPQTVALVLAHLTAEQSASVLARFNPAAQVEILRRLVELEETDPEILHEVEQALERRLSRQIQMQRRRVAGLSAVAGILQASQGGIGDTIYESLAQYDHQLADKLAPPRIDFDALLLLDSVTIGEVFQAAGYELTALALLGAPPGWAERVLAALPPAERDIIRRQLAAPGPIRLRDVEEARQHIADIANDLARDRRIGQPRRGKAALAAA